MVPSVKALRTTLSIYDDMSTPLTLPVISISPYLPSRRHEFSETDRQEVARSIHGACRDVGFFYLRVDNYLTDSERQTVLDLGREFFLQSSEEEKAKIRLDRGDGVRGELASGSTYL